jgi:hypothetical protein
MIITKERQVKIDYTNWKNERSIRLIQPIEIIFSQNEWHPGLGEFFLTRAHLQGLGGDDRARKLWKKLRGYHQRSLVETSYSRFKR